MDLEKLLVNQLSADGGLVQEYLDTPWTPTTSERYAAFLADDVSVQFNNDAPMRAGTSQRRLGQFWGAISGMGYALLHEP
jgi:hypothetical protein